MSTIGRLQSSNPDQDKRRQWGGKVVINLAVRRLLCEKLPRPSRADIRVVAERMRFSTRKHSNDEHSSAVEIHKPE